MGQGWPTLPSKLQGSLPGLHSEKSSFLQLSIFFSFPRSVPSSAVQQLAPIPAHFSVPPLIWRVAERCCNSGSFPKH